MEVVPNGTKRQMYMSDKVSDFERQSTFLLVCNMQFSTSFLSNLSCYKYFMH